jgi:RES domain-containing protein
VRLWRIAAETRTCPAQDLSGAGAARHPGRWNDEGQAVVYAATTLALAVLETAAHIDDAGLPLNRFVIGIEVPTEVWEMRETLDVDRPPPAWSSIPAGRASVTAGAAWLASLRSPILLVPSVIVPEEFIALINPAHAASAGIAAQVVRRFDYGGLFRSKSG